jgi:hypothetical protein
MNILWSKIQSVLLYTRVNPNVSGLAGCLERELQMLQLSATSCSCIAILWVSLASFAAITLCVASQRVFIVVVHFVIDSVRKLLVTPSWFTAVLQNFAEFCLKSYRHSEMLCALGKWKGKALDTQVVYVQEYNQNFVLWEHISCKIWGLHGVEDSSQGLLGCDAV